MKLEQGINNAVAIYALQQGMFYLLQQELERLLQNLVQVNVVSFVIML